MATARLYSCGSGCGFTTEDYKKLKYCSKCKLVGYCCRDCQVFHFKHGGHKHECFPPAKQRVSVIQQFCKSSDRTAEYGGNLVAKESLNGNPGCAIFLGTNDDEEERKRQGLPRHEVITDIWNMKDDTIPLSSDLYLTHVPPALICKAEDSVVESPSSYVPGKAPPPDLQCFISDSKYDNDQAFRQLVSSRIVVHALMEAFDRGIESIEVLQQVLDSADWVQQIPLPRELQKQATSLVGKTLRLEGGIEMVCITSPILCFPELTKNEFAWLNGNARPLEPLRTPMVTYRCLHEEWQITRVSPRCHLHHTLNPSIVFTSLDKDAMFFKMFVAAAEFGDVAAIYGSWTPAKSFAVFRRQEDVFVKAAHKLLSLLLQVHPEPRREEAYYLYEIGVVHESRASWLLKDGRKDEADEELLSVARCYHSSAMSTHQFFPSWHLRSWRYRALGVVLIRLGDFEMAKRALLWGLTDPFEWTSSSREKGRLVDNLRDWCKLNHLSKKQRDEIHMRSLKAQRSTSKSQEPERAYYGTECTYCEKDLKVNRENERRCSRCFAFYCSEKCQRKDDPGHRSICKAQEVTRRRCVVEPESFGACTDETQEAVAAFNVPELKFAMSHLERTQRVDRWRETKPNSLDVSVPSWLRELMEIDS